MCTLEDGSIIEQCQKLARRLVQSINNQLMKYTACRYICKYKCIGLLGVNEP